MKIKSILLVGLICSSQAFAWDIHKVQVSEKLDVIKLENKTLHLDIGLGSGAYHYKKDAPNVFYTITDRGPNIKCKDSFKLIGKNLCQTGKIFPIADFVPTIYKIKVYKKYYKILEKIQIKDANGKQISGVPNIGTEKAYDIKGNLLPFDSSGLDTEAIVKLSDGSFWISEEYGASLIHLSSDGRIIKRVVPAGFENNLQNAQYKISASLPAIIAKRPLNRGIESLAISFDEKFLYFSMQSPLANPNVKAYKSSATVRVFKYNIKEDKVVGEALYKMDKAASFKLDKKTKQSAVKISEMVLTSEDELIILERLTKTTKFYKVHFKNSIFGSKWDDIATSPTLEEDATHQKFMKKELVLDTSTIKNIPGKIEGLAYIDKNHWILVNDNDFGINKDITYITEITK